MLTQAMQWFFYGDKKLIAGFFALIIGGLICLGSVIIFRYWDMLTVVNAQVKMLEENYSHYTGIVNNEIVPRPMPEAIDVSPRRSLNGEGYIGFDDPLISQFDLFMIQEGESRYYSGSTANVLKFLILMLNEGVDVREFRLNINHYKSLLVIST